ncbi:type VI secretion protein [Massilia sp. KIM]|uniref:type VI secretion system membrane subunit TssM n=1 Tax=Massilia sp. KIM TaxID=1955422 RepID=UPI00098FDE88|nr:type VI secretion system membrane subunit TssM [Massilia sp. KIM]OON63010.1 type VI secretion protein [Massilia sp. KIM]
MKQGFLHWLSKPWILTLAGLALLSLLIWFEAPLLDLGGRAPFASAWSRWLLIGILFALAGAVFGLRLWLARRRNAGLMAEVAASPAEAMAADELAALGERMRAAMDVLRKANPGWRMRGQYLYQLPWYLFVGAPGSGKTTALTRSGLEFPLAQSLGPEAIGGVGGTRHCDWWFTDEAVLLDTAGRYTTQDSEAQAERGAWTGFLALLKKHRPRRPVNGLIVAISVADLLRDGEAAREAQARAVRSRIHELQEQLGMVFPVYVMVTKSDLLAGFAEFFEHFGREERSQVWGMTFPLDPQAQASVGGFVREFRLLEGQLQARVLERMQQERDPQRRALIYGFPQQFAALEGTLGAFLQTVFSVNRFEQAALLRGVYFTSGTQEGSPIDRVLSSVAASFGLGRRALAPAPGGGRSYFLTRLLREVVFREAGLAGLNPRAERRRVLAQRALLAGGALLAVALGAALSVSYLRNAALVDRARSASAALARQAAAAPGQGDELATLPLLDAARALPAGYAERGRDVPWLNRMSLHQGEKLGDGAIATYRRLLRSTLMPRVVARMEEALRRGDANSQDLLYETLRVYLMLGQRQYLDPASVQAWVELDWKRSLGAAGEAERSRLLGHLEAMLEPGDGAAEAVQLDAALVAQARQALSGMSLSERIYSRVKRQLAQERLPEFSVSAATGRDASGLLARASGAPLARGVDGVYTLAGYRRFAQLSWKAALDIARDNWVLGKDEGPGGALAAEPARAAVLQLYYADYIRAWDAFLGDLRPARAPSLDSAARLANGLAGLDSPLRAVLLGAARETRLAAVKPDGLLPGSAKGALAKLGAARRELEAAVGPAPDPLALAADADPVDRHFAPLHRLVAGPAPTPLDGMLALLRDAALYFDAADGARRSGAPAPATDALLRVKRGAEGQVAPLAAVLVGVHDAGAGLAQGGERERLNALWNAGPAQFCRDAIAGRYPLARDSARDATADDFGKFFAPGGLMDDFFSRHLAASVDMSGARWRWRAASGAAGFSQAALDGFQRGARLRDMFFPGGARQPSLRFALRPLALDPGLSAVTLEIDGQEVGARAGQAGRSVALQLPSGKGNGEVRLTAPGAPEQRSDGPWAWLRALDRASLEPLQAERYRLAFALDGRKASFELTAGSVINPFRRDATAFACPAAL